LRAPRKSSTAGGITTVILRVIGKLIMTRIEHAGHKSVSLFASSRMRRRFFSASLHVAITHVAAVGIASIIITCRYFCIQLFRQISQFLAADAPGNSEMTFNPRATFPFFRSGINNCERTVDAVLDIVRLFERAFLDLCSPSLSFSLSLSRNICSRHTPANQALMPARG